MVKKATLFMISLVTLFLALLVTTGTVTAAPAAKPLSQYPPPPTPPANDHFADATLVTALSKDYSIDNRGATVEVGEPFSNCASGPASQTVWYVYTPNETIVLSFNFSTFFNSFVAIYSGHSLADLTQVQCASYGAGSLPVIVTAGSTYYFQIGGIWGNSGTGTFRLEAVPNPQPSINYSPYDPSIYENVEIYGSLYDPFPIKSWIWKLGDGTTGTDNPIRHQYATDGQYLVELNVITVDGRSGTAQQTITVKTHDVAIISFSRPKSMRVGQTYKLIVSVRNKRHPENVRVELYKGTPNGSQSLGSLLQYVPAQSGKQSTDFYFSYTPNSTDAQIGKVTFKAIANIEGSSPFGYVRDAFPADNEFIASPIQVSVGKQGAAADSTTQTNELDGYVTDYVTAPAIDASSGEMAGKGGIFSLFFPLMRK